MRGKRALTLAPLAIALFALSGAPAFAASSGNLLVGGDGEAANCTTDWSAVTSVPGWTVTQGNPSVVCYSIGSFNTPSGGSPGRAFIADGPYGDSALRQLVAAGTVVDFDEMYSLARVRAER